MLIVNDFKKLVIEPTLNYLEMSSPAAINLLLGTALMESRLKHLIQKPNGPALGLYQMEPATHKDIWDNFLKYKQALAERVGGLIAPSPESETQLKTNLSYATAMCRIHYYRAPTKLPDAEDLEGLSNYWKKYYNTELGAGKPEEFREVYSVYNK